MTAKNALLLSFSLTCDPSTFSFISKTFQESLVSETSMHHPKCFFFYFVCIAIATCIIQGPMPTTVTDILEDDIN